MEILRRERWIKKRAKRRNKGDIKIMGRRGEKI
jgi:hypothetical protein